MLYRLEEHVLYCMFFSPIKYYSNETKNNLCLKNSRNTLGHLECLALFAKKSLLLRKLDFYLFDTAAFHP